MTSREALIDEVQTLRARVQEAEEERDGLQTIRIELAKSLAASERDKEGWEDRCRAAEQRLARVCEWRKRTAESRRYDDMWRDLDSILDSEEK